MQWLKITKYDYLKTPKFKWTLKNDVGGSFSNSGEYLTIKSLGKALKAQYPDLNPDTKVIIEIIHGFDDKDNPVTTSKDSYYYKLFH